MTIDHHNHHNLCLSCMEEKGEAQICPLCGYEEGHAPESALHLPPGTVLQEKYLIGRALGQGGFGITYLAYNTTLNIKLAIKEYLPQQLATRTSGQHEITVVKRSLAEEFNYGLSKFLEEARTLARFNEHPNIVTVRDYFEANSTAYLVMNYYEGLTLQEYLETSGGKIELEQAMNIFMPVLDALKEVHFAGILHRDISPDNLLIDTNGRVVLIDFGAARQAMGEQSRSMSVIMKAGYSPEEQYRSKGEQGPWTDIYAVAATMYHAVTGVMPLESLERMTEDTLVPPSQLGMEIEPHQEQALLKALEVRARDRFQTVEEFQEALLGKKQPGEKKSPEAVKKEAEKPDRENVKHEDIKNCPFCGEQIKSSAIVCKHCKMSLQEDLSEAKKRPEKPRKAGHTPLTNQLTKAAVILLGLVIVFYAGSWFFSEPVEEVTIEEEKPSENDSAVETEATDEDVDLAQRLEKAYEPETVEVINEADYMIDYEHGTIPLSEVEIGARVIDPTWEWEFRTGEDYTRQTGDETKPVNWLVVAKNHYEGLEPHVTLLSEELIGRHAFDNSSHVTDWGYNHWGESGAHSSADRGLRPWLNSTGIHSNEGFLRSFSEDFKQDILNTTVPNKEWQNGIAYSTNDQVFIPSTTELGDAEHHSTYQIGTAYPYLREAESSKRVAKLGEDTKPQSMWYWTRSPDSFSFFAGSANPIIDSDGDIMCGEFSEGMSYREFIGVRPALNLKSELLVSEINQ